jgi:hypothetical protein
MAAQDVANIFSATRVAAVYSRKAGGVVFTGQGHEIHWKAEEAGLFPPNGAHCLFTHLLAEVPIISS